MPNIIFQGTSSKLARTVSTNTIVGTQHCIENIQTYATLRAWTVHGHHGYETAPLSKVLQWRYMENSSTSLTFLVLMEAHTHVIDSAQLGGRRATALRPGMACDCTGCRRNRVMVPQHRRRRQCAAEDTLRIKAGEQGETERCIAYCSSPFVDRSQSHSDFNSRPARRRACSRRHRS